MLENISSEVRSATVQEYMEYSLFYLLFKFPFIGTL